MDDLAAAVNNLAIAIAAVTIGSAAGAAGRRGAWGRGGSWYCFQDVWWWGQWGTDGQWWWWNEEWSWISDAAWTASTEGTVAATPDADAEMASKRQRRD
jgi:hypothetical protein